MSGVPSGIVRPYCRETLRSSAFPGRKTPIGNQMTTAKTAPKPLAAAPAKKVPANSNRKHEFKTNDHVVYPTHGVGKVSGIE